VPLNRRLRLLFLVILCGPALAGEIPGLPAGLPPFIERDVELNFGNDFLGRGASTDDFRTQQTILMARFGERWMALLDHSILTLSHGLAAGRIDQLSASVGYFLINGGDESLKNSVAIGAGLRSTGDFNGEALQNGFHRLVDSGVVHLPYTGVDKTAATVWIDAEHYKQFHEPSGSGAFGDWRAGYWLRANSLLTTDGQWDGSAAAYIVASRNVIDVWFGLRRDFRTGYDDPVLRETAVAEDDLAVVLGARFGALVLETVQQINNEASYGQIRLVSSGYRSNRQSDAPTRYGIEFGFLLPDVHVQLSGRIRTGWDSTFGPLWPSFVVADLRYGQPQFGNITAAYVQSEQIGLGLEWSRSLPRTNNWITWYGTLGTGWRSEQLVGDGALTGEKSAAVSRTVLTLASGLRFDAAELGSHWRLRIQTGISAWLPVNDADVTFAGEQFSIQNPTVGLFLGMTFESF
jgi:hypothetical protein